jgi:hypothetical protein
MRISSPKLAVWGVLLLAASAVFAQMPQPFSADMTTTMKNGEKMTGKWYFAPPNMRVDVTSPSPQSERGNGAGMFGNMIVITNVSTQTTYMLMPQQQMYMEFHGDRQNSMSPGLRNLLHLKPGADPCSNDSDKTCKRLGTETVNGRSCDKWEMTDKKTGQKGTLWVDQKLHVPIRVVNDDGFVMDLTNIKEGSPDASLFKVPAGYKPFDPAAFGGQSGQRRPK